MHRPPLPPGNIPGTRFCWRLSQPQGHSAAGRSMSMKNSNDIIGNQTRDLHTCSAVLQATALLRVPAWQESYIKIQRLNALFYVSKENVHCWWLTGSQVRTTDLIPVNVSCIPTGWCFSCRMCNCKWSNRIVCITVRFHLQ